MVDDERVAQITDEIIRRAGRLLATKDHDYVKDPGSGAGNCWCGAAKEWPRHPHSFTPAHIDPMRCVCGQRPNFRNHRG